MLVSETISSRDTSDLEEGENPVSSSDEKSASEEDTGSSSKYLFPVEDIDELLKAIYTSEQIEMPQQAQSVQDKMYRGLQGRKSKNCTVHQSLRDIILSE